MPKLKINYSGDMQVIGKIAFEFSNLAIVRDWDTFMCLL